MELNKNNMKKIMVIITFTVILCALLINFSAFLKYLGFLLGVLYPFILGAAIAFCLNIPMCFFERKLFSVKNGKKPRVRTAMARPVSLTLTLLCLAGVIALVIGVVVPQLGSTFESISDAMKTFLPKAQIWLEERFSGKEEVVNYISSINLENLDWGKWVETLKDFAVNGAGSVLSYTINATVAVVNSTVTFFVAFIFAIYVLTQKEKLAYQATKIVQAFFSKKAVEKILHVCSLSHFTFSRFITGQCVEALILGAMFFVAMVIFRFPYALLVGILIAFTALIPIVGAFIGCFIGAFLILMVNPMQAFAFVIMFLILQQIEGNLIYPHVVGNSVGLPSMWVLFAAMVGGSLMGIAGMLIFIPIMSVLYSLMRDWVNTRLKEKKMEAS
ncbi:MAG: AI-2E family transporter [Lachnospiraceae bacterium]|nr:AI-2E family transporter [Lachnospiraceae bacterium]